MMVSLKSFVLQHPKIVVGITMLVIALLAMHVEPLWTEPGWNL